MWFPLLWDRWGPESAWGTVSGAEAGKQSVEAVFEPSVLVDAAAEGGRDGGEGGNLFGWQRGVVTGVDATHLVVAGGVGEQGEEGVGGFGCGQAGSEQQLESGSMIRRPWGPILTWLL